MTSGLCEMKVWCSLQRLLIVSLLVLTNIASLHGNHTSAVNGSLQCVTDYISLINCSLNVTTSPNSSSTYGSYWLTVMEEYVKEKFVCMLFKDGAGYSCSVKISSPMADDDYDTSEFMKQDIYEISFCHNQVDGVQICKALTEKFKPYRNVKPNPPCCLALNQQSGQHHFTWMSTYEKYSVFSALSDSLTYQLRFYKKGDGRRVVPHVITMDKKNFSVDDQKFLSDTEYSASVRSSPDQASYMGQWSSWSSELHWRTKPSLNVQRGRKEKGDGEEKVQEQGKRVFISLIVVVPLVLLLCYAPVRKWRQSSFIPTPAPYFHTLYQDYHGDFKSWVVTPENTADMLEAEETLHIDTLTKCAEVEEKRVEEEQEEEKGQPPCQHHFIEGSVYSNIMAPGYDTSLLGLPYAVSTMSPQSDPGGSLRSLTFSSPPGSPAEVDSGCWLSSHTSLEKDPPWYCNEYCTLTAFQQISPVTAMKSCTDREEQSGCHY